VTLLYYFIPWVFWEVAIEYSAFAMACLYVVNGLGFMYFGVRLIVVLHRNTVLTRGSNKTAKVGLLASVCTLIFLARATMVFFTTWKRQGEPTTELDGRSFGAPLYVVCLYYSVGEMFAEGIMLFIFRKRPRVITDEGSATYSSNQRRRRKSFSNPLNSAGATTPLIQKGSTVVN